MNLTIYDGMHDHLKGLHESMEQVKPFGIQIPPMAREYITYRRAALSDASVRAQDTASKHITWLHYYQQMDQEAVVDMVAWELTYKELATTYSTTVEALNCLEMSMSSDPATPYIKVKGLKPMTEDDKTTPEYVALATVLAEDNDWDMAELLPPILALSHEDMISFDEVVEHVFKDMGVSDTPPSFLEVILNSDTGVDVSLA